MSFNCKFILNLMLYVYIWNCSQAEREETTIITKEDLETFHILFHICSRRASTLCSIPSSKFHCSRFPLPSSILLVLLDLFQFCKLKLLDCRGFDPPFVFKDHFRFCTCWYHFKSTFLLWISAFVYALFMFDSISSLSCILSLAS